MTMLERGTPIFGWLSLAALVVSGCGTHTVDSGERPGSATACTPGVPGCPTASTSAGTNALQAQAGSPNVAVASAGKGGTTVIPPGTGGTSAPLPAAGGVPCDVASIVTKNCTLCHAAVPKFGAPMPLMTLADFQAPSRSMPSMAVHQVIPSRIKATDPNKLMPPVSATKLTAAELQTFGAWLTAGAKAATPGCAVTETTATAMPDPVTGSGMGGASITPIDYQDPDMKCYRFLAHAAGDMTKPYMQGAGEEYVDFSFKAPWTGTVYSRSIKLVLDPDSKVLHHWLLFKDTSAKTDGAVQPVGLLGLHTDGAILLHGWAPGASDVYLDPDVGMKLEANVSYTIESHLYNQGTAPSGDHSGAEVCVTTKVPTHIADISWVGTDAISGTTASGTCTPHGSEPIHLIAAQPHMHLKGRHMQVVINRKNGIKEMIHDEDFSFDNQRYYVENSILMPGDTMTTTCTYSGPATFGPSTNQEMCYFFSMHWPGGAIGSASLIHGANTCLN
jgi:hypothetical protein